jgi:hypothetical protein
MKIKKRVKELEIDAETFYDTWQEQFEANEGFMQLFAKIADTLVGMNLKIKELEEALAKTDKAMGPTPVPRVNDTEIKDEMESRITEAEDRDELYHA